MSVMRKIEVTEPLIERLLGEVGSEIARRSDLTDNAVNIDDPFQNLSRTDTSRVAEFNLASVGGRFGKIFGAGFDRSQDPSTNLASDLRSAWVRTHLLTNSVR